MPNAHISCRLCGGESHLRFSQKILMKYQVNYFECENCRSLMTEEPYWLAEAYSSNICSLDTGAVFRNLNNFAASYLFCDIFSVKNALEYGASDGLVSRFLRDLGVNCVAYDKYGSMTYIQGFLADENSKPELVMMYEVVEHFSDPETEFSSIFKTRPNFVLFSTGLYNGQGADWDYLAVEGGQHIFFYSVDALKLISGKFGYKVVQLGPFFLFINNSVGDIHQKLAIAQFSLSGWPFQALKSHVLCKAPVGIMPDMDAIRKRLHSGA